MRHPVCRRSTLVILIYVCVADFTFAQLVMMDFADGGSNATAPPPLSVITETCGDSFNKFALVPATAKQDHEVGRLVDFDGGPGWGPFMIISGNEKALFKIDREGTIRVAFPFFDLDEYRLRLASLNGNLICTVQINIRIGNNSFSATPAVHNQTFEDNSAIRPEDGTTALVWSQSPTTARPATTVPVTTPTSPTTFTVALTTNATTVLPLPTTNGSNSSGQPLANLVTNLDKKDLSTADDATPFDLDKTDTQKKQGIIGPPIGGTFPLGPRCSDPFLTVALPSDTPVNTPITRVTATHQVGTPIFYTIGDVVFDRFRVDPVTGQVFTGPQPLSSRGGPFTGLRVSPQTRSALEFRVRASIPDGQHCETVIRVNVISSPNAPIQLPGPPQVLPGRSPPFFIMPTFNFPVRNCQSGQVIGRAEAQDADLGDRITYLIDNPSNEVSVDPNSGVLRVGNAVNFQSRLIRPIIRAVDSTGLSTTATVTAEFLCEIAPQQLAQGPLRFSQQAYRFPVFNCNAGTIAGSVMLLGGAVSPVRFELSNPFEFALETNGPNALIRLAALMGNGVPQRNFEVIATDAAGTRTQAMVTLDMVCGPIEPPSAFRPMNGPPLLDQNLIGFSSSLGSMPLGLGPQPLLPPARAILPQPGFGQDNFPLGLPPGPPFPPSFLGENFPQGLPPGFIPMSFPLGPPSGPAGPGPFLPGLVPGNFPQGPNGFPPMQLQPGNFPQQPGLFPLGPGAGVPFPGPMFQQQFPPRQLEVNQQPGMMPPSGEQNTNMNNNVQQAVLNGEITFVSNRPTGPRPTRPLLIGEPDRGEFIFHSSQDNNANQTPQDEKPPEDPNQRAIEANPQRQLTGPQGPTGPFGPSNPSGQFGFAVLTSPQMNGPIQTQQSMLQVFPPNEPMRFPPSGGFSGSGLPFAVLGPAASQGANFPSQQPNFAGGMPFGGPGSMMGGFGPMNEPFRPKQLFGQFPGSAGPLFAPGLPDLTIQLPQPGQQTPPIFVTPLCAPPNTNAIGRVRAIDPEPNDRITYFIFSAGGTDLFDVHPATGEIRSRNPLATGTYNVDVGARDSTGRTAIMRLEISINPACLQPRMMIDFPILNANPFSSSAQPLDSRQLLPFNPLPIQPPAFRPNRLLTSKTSPCAEDFVPNSPDDRASSGPLPTVNHFGVVRQLSKSGGLSVKGPTVIAVDSPFDGSTPVTLAVGTILAEFVVAGGSGTYRWVDRDISQFEMTGESIGSLRTTSPLPLGTYEYNLMVKDNIGNVAAFKVRIVIRSPEFVDNGLFTSRDLPLSVLRSQEKSHRDGTS